MKEIFFTQLEKYKQELVDIRRDLHMYPELSNEEKRTPEIVAEYLTDLGIDVQTGVGGSGVVGRLKGGKPGKTITLRADFDALPIQDEKDVPYRSKIDGVSHACGHDIHTAALLGIAKLLSKHKDQIQGTVVFIHQFAEEVAPGGAKRMIEDGCLKDVNAIYGAHVWSENPLGDVFFIKGAAMAAADTFRIHVAGKGGHGAMPHLSVDPIVAISQLVTSLQQIVSRNIDPLKSAVITVGSIHGGKAENVIPDTAEIAGTIRTFDQDIREYIEKRMSDLCEALEKQHNVNVTFTYRNGHDSVYNHVKETEDLKERTEAVLSDHTVTYESPIMGAEDFSYYLQKVPGTFFYVGGRSEDINAVYPHHHPKFDVDEESMISIGKVFLVALGLQDVIKV